MGLRERLGLDDPDPGGSDTDDVPVVIPSAWVTRADTGARPALALRPLGQSGYGLRDPESGAPLTPDREQVRELGAVVADLEDIGPRRDDTRVLVSAPGQVLSLVVEDDRVAVYDRTGTYDIGYLDDELAAIIAAALGADIRLRVVSLWETRSLDDRRTALRVLIVPAHVDLIAGDGRVIDLTTE